MKKKHLLKSFIVWGFMLMVAMVTGAVLLPGIVATVRAEETPVRTITGLGTGTIGNPSSGAGGWSYVYYGRYGSSPVKYRVLRKDTTGYGGESGTHTMLLDCDTVLLNKRFNEDTLKNTWADSDIRSWLNGESFLGSSDVFTEMENAAIITSKADSYVYEDQINDLIKDIYNTYVPLNDRIFLLDAWEVTTKTYGYTGSSLHDNTRAKNGNATDW